MKRWIGMLSAVSLLSLAASTAMAELKAGDAAPAFELPGSDGKTYKLADFQDKQVVIVAWYPKAFTGGWTKECESLRESGDDLRQFNAAYFAASCDPPEKNKAFAESLKLDFPILSDPGGKIAKAYGVVTDQRPFPFRWTFYIGTDGKILFIDKSVKAASHGDDIVEQLEQLKVDSK